MKRATLSAVPAPAPSSANVDLTDRLLSRESDKGIAAAGPKTRAQAKGARPRSRQSERPAAETTGAAEGQGDNLAPALQAAQQAVEALQLAARSEPARYEVALRFRLDALAHHVQQVKDFVAAALAR
jgi:hypothetical protein